MTKQQIKNKLIQAGIKNLKEFGYPYVNNKNILSDLVYASFFKSMLEENKGQSISLVDECIDELIDVINQLSKD